ncbi:MAG: hypothetical protein OHK0022_48340 [Roseiflexaceae bacterium]
MSSQFTVEVIAGPIFSNSDAQVKAPLACAIAGGTWNGEWHTVVEGKMSVCGCVITIPSTGTSEFTINIPAGPIYSNEDAQTKCPIVCASRGGTWNGVWNTVVEGMMSVCGCTFKV